MSDHEALDHIPRAMVPWRNAIDELTECGQRSADVSIIDIDDVVTRYRRLGQKRFAMTVCMTCFGKVHYAGRLRTDGWHDDPIGIMRRELDRVTRMRGEAGRTARDLVARELVALGMLADDHRGEFDEAVDPPSDTVDLGAFRRQQRGA